MRRGTLLGSLSQPDFRRLWLATATSGSGQWALQLALGWLVQTLTHSSFWVGTALFAMQIPNVLAAPWSGVLSDRFERSRVLTVSMGAAAVGTLALAALSGAGRASLPAVLAIVFLIGVAGTVMMVSSSALLANVITDRDLLNAAALQAIAQRGSEFIGPAVGAILLAITGSWSVFALCAVFYVLGVQNAWGIRRRAASAQPAADLPAAPAPTAGKPAATPAGAPSGRFRASIHYVRTHQPLGLIVSLVGLHCPLTMCYMAVLPAFVLTSLHGGAGLFGTAMTLVGLGSALGALPLLFVKAPRMRGRLMLWSGVLSGASLIALGMSHAAVPALASLVVVGASQSMFMTITLAEVQERSDDAYRGRVSSIYLLQAGGSMAVASPIYGFLGGIFGAAHILDGMGTAFVIVFLVYVASSLRLRGMCHLGARGQALASVQLAGGS